MEPLHKSKKFCYFSAACSLWCRSTHHSFQVSQDRVSLKCSSAQNMQSEKDLRSSKGKLCNLKFNCFVAQRFKKISSY